MSKVRILGGVTGLFLTISTLSWYTAAAEDCKAELTNGCTTFGFPAPYKEDFTPACVEHDHCYGCGADDSHNISRKECDMLFKSKMEKMCEQKNWWCRFFCNIAKEKYYKIVRKLGSSFYRESHETSSHCTESWVSQCMGR